jgi:hypothetical protein
MDDKTIARFHAKYIPEPNSGCWLWDGWVNGRGYGRFGKGLAHRISWELHRGPIPAGMNICHKCDVPPCVNPDHLFLGTQTDNMRDCARKGRLGAHVVAVGAANLAKTHCPQGHQYTPRNTYHPPGTRHRSCVRCSRLSAKLSHRRARGGRPSRIVVGEAHYAARLTADDVVNIRARAAAGESTAALAREYGVGWNTCRSAILRRTWKHIR